MVDTVPEGTPYAIHHDGMQLSRLEGWGNTFYVLLVPEPDLNVSNTPFADAADRAELARRLCLSADDLANRRADGLIFGLFRRRDDGSVALGDDQVDADCRMVLHNADGSPAEMSGNGLRCLAHALARLAGDDGLDHAEELEVDGLPRKRGPYDRNLRFRTDAGPRAVRLMLPADGLYEEGTGQQIEVPRDLNSLAQMGAVGQGPKVTPAQRRLACDELGATNVATRSVGNPHLVIHVPASEKRDAATAGRDDLRRWGRLLARADEPEHSVNVELISTDPTAVDVSERPPQPDGAGQHQIPPWRTTAPNRIFMLVWERGVGPTLACGTGAIAAARQAADWQQAGLADWQSINPDAPIEVVMSENGVATVHLSDRSTWLQGPTKRLEVLLRRTDLEVALA